MLSFIRKNNNIFSATLFTGLFLFGLFFSVSETKAAASTTLRGSAWWGNDKGYVYFNCKDDVMGDKLDVLNNLSGSGKYPPPDDKFHFYAPPCLSSSHYVYIDTSGNFRGQAWNQIKGFISFEGSDDPPGGYGDLSSSGRCGSTCNTSNNCWGCYVESQKKVYGWARVDLTGEWIRLDNTSQTPIFLETCSASPIIYSAPSVSAIGLEPGDFHGLATTDTLGSLFFNCKNDPSDPTCLDRNYKVWIETLSLGSLTAPNFSYTEACSGNSLGATLGWCVKSGQQKAYEVVINKTDFGPTPTPANLSSAFCWSGIVQSSGADQFLPHISCTNSLEYGTDYYWWLRLYDENNKPTQWYQYFGNTIDDTDGDADRLTRVDHEKTFSTFKHRFPTPFFTWSPFDILVGSSTKFSATSSIFYTGIDPNGETCYGTYCQYSWTTTDSKAIFSATNTIETDIIFKIATDTTVSLVVTDLDNYMCKMTSAIIKINYDLPIWREIKAK